MGTIQVREMTGGLDARRLPEISQGGSLIRAYDGHINRGGAFEKRAAFVPRFTLPPGIVGLARTRGALWVFGTVPSVQGLPPGFRYMAVPHPSGPSVSLVDVPSWDVFGDRIFAACLYSDGRIFYWYDGVRVTDFWDGRARCAFQITGGTDTDTISAVTVAGANIMGPDPVPWKGTAAATAAALVANINAEVDVIDGVPSFEAVAFDSVVTIVATESSASINGLAVGFQKTEGLTIYLPSPVLSSGSDPTAYGALYTPGPFVKTNGQRILALSDVNLFGSGLAQPTQFNGGGANPVTGAFFIDMSTTASGGDRLTSLARYNNLMAVFSERTVQLWYFEPDPTNIRQTQVLENTGTIAPLSVTQYGDTDVYYLDYSGVRSLKARDASNAAFSSDIGNPIDPLLLPVVEALTPEDRARYVIGLIEPRDGRFWLIVRDRIFVFSYFSSSKVSAWTIYRLPFVVDHAVIFGNRVYLRSGETIYVYGGTGNVPVYDDTECEAWLPFLDANAPTRVKRFQGIDAVTRGTWKVGMAFRPNSPDAELPVAEISDTTYCDQRIPAVGESTHLSLRFRSVGTGPALLAQAVIHYEGDANEDAAQG